MKTWKPKGTRAVTPLRLITNPALLSLITIATVAVIVYFGWFGNWRLWAVALSSAALTIASIALHRRAQNKTNISRRQFMKYNTFHYIMDFYDNFDKRHIDTSTERTPSDSEISHALYCRLCENLITCGVFKETGRIKVNQFNGIESEELELARYFTDFTIAVGVGYVLFEPFTEFKDKIKKIDESVISRSLIEIGLVGWSVERIDYEHGAVILFVLRDESISRAYDISGDMFQQFLTLSEQGEDYEIPLQKDTLYSLRTAPHAVLSGTTGFGKSYLTLYLIIMLSLKNNVLFLADPKRSDLYSLSAFMPENRVEYKAECICKMVSSVVEIMEKRYEIMEKERLQKGLFQADFADFGLNLVVLVMEEMAAFVSNLSDKKMREKFDSDIKAITLLGRQAGVMLISIMQQPNANNISTESRSQMGLRVYLGNSGGIENRMIFGEGFDYPKRVFSAGQGLYMLAGQTNKPEIIETPRLDKNQLPETLKCALQLQHELNPLI